MAQSSEAVEQVAPPTMSLSALMTTFTGIVVGLTACPRRECLSSSISETPHGPFFKLLSGEKPVRLFILGTQESAPDLRRSLSQFEWIELCGDAFDRREGVAKVVTLEPDVLVMSSGPWDAEYADTVREVRRVSPRTKIVVISDPDDARTKRDARDAGATVYIARGAVWTSLMSALRKLERRLRARSQS